ncbi:uncharacterized protein LOC110852794 [Folsomia candida]|uniref:Uncharacterized protein n=1 Tax=Folsomia candida TaxID=158441 RepID=A0A226E3X0_FOLCA|nr:uncharacterized protein LOC110852794 [Folsomia candida]OXA52129.1 hypothetical protein Fcan01_13801 [Folsomia candida]
MISPCCGSSLQQGTKFLAMFSMMLSVAGMGISSIILFSLLVGGPKSRGEPGEGEDDPTSIGIKYFIALLTFIFNLFLAILLFIGAEQKNLRLCYVWFKVTIFLFCLDLVLLGFSIYLDLAGIEDYVVNISGIFYSLYELWVVFAFTTEIKSQKETISGCHTISTSMTV